MTGIGEILNGGFRVLGRRPASVALWALLHAALGGLGLLLLIPRMKIMIDTMSQVMVQAANNPGQPPVLPMTMMQNMAGMQGLSLLMGLVGSFLGAMLLCGAFRATLRPEERSFASLRLGMDELRIFAMTWIVLIGGAIAMFIAFLLLALLIAALGFALHNSPAIAVLMGVVLWLAATCAVVFVVVRLSMLFPLTFLRREFVFDEAWRVTRGRFWTLFLAYFIVFILIVVLWTIVSTPISLTMFANIPPLPQPHDPQAAAAWMSSLMAKWFDHPFGTFALFALVGAVVQSISTALFGGAMATAAHGFLADDGRLPETLE